MKTVLILTLALALSSCVTSATVGLQNKCNDEKRERQADPKLDLECGNVNQVISAVGSDVEIVKNISNFVQQEYFTDKTLPPVHHGDDTSICSSHESKVCSVTDGCICEANAGRTPREPKKF